MVRSEGSRTTTFQALGGLQPDAPGGGGMLCTSLGSCSVCLAKGKQTPLAVAHGEKASITNICSGDPKGLSPVAAGATFPP